LDLELLQLSSTQWLKFVSKSFHALSLPLRSKSPLVTRSCHSHIGSRLKQILQRWDYVSAWGARGAGGCALNMAILLLFCQILELLSFTVHWDFILPGLCCINFSGCFLWGWILNRCSAFKRLSPFNKAFPTYYYLELTIYCFDTWLVIYIDVIA
jgi:hypothetical protein